MDQLDTLLGWLPQFPWRGPPLPIWLDIRWRPPEEEPALPQWELLTPPKQYVSKVTISRLGKRKKVGKVYFTPWHMPHLNSQI